MSSVSLLQQRALQKLDAVARLTEEVAAGSLDLNGIADRCDDTARELVSAASLLRRIAKQQKKSVAAGAVTNASTKGETPCAKPN
jgi:hypothetical protein